MTLCEPIPAMAAWFPDNTFRKFSAVTSYITRNECWCPSIYNFPTDRQLYYNTLLKYNCFITNNTLLIRTYCIL